MVAVLVIAAAAWAGLQEAGDRSPRIERGLRGVLGILLVAITAVNAVAGATAGTPQGGDTVALEALMPAVLDEVDEGDTSVLVRPTGSRPARGTPVASCSSSSVVASTSASRPIRNRCSARVSSAGTRPT